MLKTVPLVIYRGEERVVIGEAFVEWDEDDITVRATIKDEFLTALEPLVSVKGISEGVIHPDFSIGFPFEKETISEQHARMYGAPAVTRESIAAWNETVKVRE